jgi:hypothetical protein
MHQIFIYMLQMCNHLEKRKTIQGSKIFVLLFSLSLSLSLSFSLISQQTFLYVSPYSENVFAKKMTGDVQIYNNVSGLCKSNEFTRKTSCYIPEYITRATVHRIHQLLTFEFFYTHAHQVRISNVQLTIKCHTFVWDHYLLCNCRIKFFLHTLHFVFWFF